tara:strand:- start:19 stop:783 length:765 start_codon:yes stop_codon:yes gene_type:complete
MSKDDEYTNHLLLNLRSQFVTRESSWDQVIIQKAIPISDTAMLLCDLWDKHWCSAAAKRSADIAGRTNEVVRAARKNGVQIIHSPSGTMDFYVSTNQRIRMVEITKIIPPEPIEISAPPPLPIDDSDGGCDSEESLARSVWTRQHEAIEIGDGDVISDDGEEIYSFMIHSGINNLIVAGVHLNMCVLNRTFGIKKMIGWGINCVLVRDLTDAMYNPGTVPYVTHDRGTDLVIEYIERHWCPSILSDDLIEKYSV